jgi:uncharacterized protein (TIGR00266 family)
MQIDVIEKGAFQYALVQLESGEEFVSESAAMFRCSANIDIDVTTKSKGKGGLLGGLKRLVGGENFFFSTYSTNDGRNGEVGIAPTLPGEIKVIELDASMKWICTGGSYLASTPELEINTKFQGFKGMFTGEAPFFVEVSGVGELLVTAFGRIAEMSVPQSGLTVDTGHVVAYESTLTYEIGKAGSSWIQSFLAGEGMVIHFSGQGKILTQSHNPSSFGRSLGPMLPPR